MEPLPFDRDRFVSRQDLLSRRAVLRTGVAGLAGASWLTYLAEALALQHEAKPHGEPALSLIFLWLGGGPSQLETFDPKPGTRVAAGTRAIATSVAGIQLAEGLEGLSEQMHDVSLVRSLVSKEGDHERGAYLMKTGYRPDPTVVHPSIGAICCQQLPESNTEIPRHVAILSGQFPPRGGYLGNQYDAFKTFDPRNPVPDIKPRVSDTRQDARLADRELVDRAFAAGREQSFARTMHGDLIERARRMMGSEQLAAFDVSQEPAELQARYGDTPFGRGCLAARRLVEQGVRCVEVTLEAGTATSTTTRSIVGYWRSSIRRSPR
jgi:hypothetical protein